MGWISGKPALTLRAFRPDRARGCSSGLPGGGRTSWRANVRKLGAALPAAMLLVGAAWTTAAFADEPILTKAPVVSVPSAGQGPCDSVPAFFLTSCQLAWYGVRVLRHYRRRRRLPDQRRAVQSVLPARQLVRRPKNEPGVRCGRSRQARCRDRISVSRCVSHSLPAGHSSASWRPALTLIRCNFQTARHQSRTTEAFRSSTRARITT